MIRKPRITIGGSFGFEISRLWDALLAKQPLKSPQISISQTTRGTSLELKRGAQGDDSFTRPARIVSETRQWLKCTYELDYVGEPSSYVWVAKPPALRVPGVALTPITYAALTWGTFSVEHFTYRNAFERLRRFANPNAMTLGRGFTLYESWPTATNRANMDTYAALGAASVPFEENKIGAVDWIYDFEVVYPFYTFITGTNGTPVTITSNRIIYVTRKHAEDVVSEVPDDPTFASSAKMVDCNFDGRRWTPKHVVFPRNFLTFEFGGAGTTLGTANNTTYPVSALPVQFNDQLMAEENPTMALFITLNYWTELQP